MNYVDNTVDGFVAIGHHAAAAGEVINIGSGREISVGDLAKMIVGIVGSRSEIVEDTARIRPRDSEVERLLCDHAKAQRVVGWSPRVTLEDGLARTIDWIARNLDRYKADIYNV